MIRTVHVPRLVCRTLLGGHQLLLACKVLLQLLHCHFHCSRHALCIVSPAVAAGDLPSPNSLLSQRLRI